MDSVGIKKIEIIVLDLLAEFEKESGKLQTEYDDNVSRILEIEENIHNYKENEDIDFQVFSPRKIDNQNEAKIDRMNKEKESIEIANKSLYRQIKYYSEKTGKLKEILNVIYEDNDDMEYERNLKSKEADITEVDEKILAYYDSIVEGDEDNSYPEEPENIGTEVRSGWRIIKDELDSPITQIKSSSNSSEVLDNLLIISNKLERESKAIEEDYLRTKDEINSVLSDINIILNNLK